MDFYLLIGKTILAGSFFLYWNLLFHLSDQVLGTAGIRKKYKLPIILVNTAITLFVSLVVSVPAPLFILMFFLMLADFSILYKKPFTQIIFCANACIIHVLIMHTTVTGIFSIFCGSTAFAFFHVAISQIYAQIVVFLLLNIAILLVLNLLPIHAVRIINDHKDLRRFLLAWMSINNLYLLYYVNVFYNQQPHRYWIGTQVASPLTVLCSLYIMLFFSIKAVSLLGYKEKSDELAQTVVLEQQYRNSILKDAIISYDVNVSRNILLRGFENLRLELGDMVDNYTDMLTFMSNKNIHSDDIKSFMQYATPDTLLRAFQDGKSETIEEYRRLTDNGCYIWVRSVTNLVKDMETGDVIAYVCIKNIDAEKKRQLALQHMAERDPLTGLYNKALTAKLVNEHLHGTQAPNYAALLIIDVDNFKSINDHFGHVYGDAVLCELADKLQHICSGEDIIGRIGGDEYIAFLQNNVSPLLVQAKAAEICAAFFTTYSGMQNDKYTISSSIGIAIFPKDGCSFELLYAHADAALYQAKSNGKNNYQLYDGSDFTGYESDRAKIQPNKPVLQKNFRQNRIEYVFKVLYQSENPVAAIHATLELIARHFSFERGYIFETGKDGKTTSNTIEWCANGVKSEIDNLQNIPIEAVATANQSFYETGVFILKTLDALQPTERAVLEPQGIKSMFQFGIFEKHQLLGFIGFDNYKTEIVPTAIELDEMKTICNILATFFVKHHNDVIATQDLKVWQAVIDNLNEYIYVVTPTTFEVLFINRHTRKRLHDAQCTAPCYQFFRGHHAQCPDCPIKKLTDEVTESTCELYNERLGIWTETSVSALQWIDGSLAYLINCTDITKQKEEHLRHIKQLETLAFVDELTKIRTFYKFKIDAQQILKEQTDTGHFLAKLDIDNFKLINQLYGYEKGNEVLRCVARALAQTARNPNEIFARVSNDEFIALFSLANSGDVAALYTTFLHNFYTVMGPDFGFKCTFPRGVCLVTASDVQNLDMNDLFEKVNVAHKTAKLNHSGALVVYNKALTRAALHTTEIESKMADALQNNEFTVYLQPKYHLDTEMVGGAEALTRWRNENSALFAPNSFIPVFERNGFITKLDFYVLETVCVTIKNWIAAGIKPVVVSVNFSKLHLNNRNFIKELCEVVDRVGIDRKYIEIEITESGIYDNIDKLETLLCDLHQNGFAMSMDDFGSGYSSLGMLKDLPVDIIKMDRGFFANQKDIRRSKIVVGSIINMAAGLGIRIVAEGVEEQQHIDLLRELHCDMVQGYYYAKPMPIQNFTALIQNPIRFSHDHAQQ